MKLVTFRAPSGQLRCGALVDGDRKVVDLQAAHQARWSAEHSALASVLAIMEGGADTLDIAREAVKAATPQVTLDRGAITLMAPLPHPRAGCVRRTRPIPRPRCASSKPRAS